MTSVKGMVWQAKRKPAASFIGANSISLGRRERGDAACQGAHQAGVAPPLSPTHRHHLDAGSARRVEQRLPGRDIHSAADRLQIDMKRRMICVIAHFAALVLNED